MERFISYGQWNNSWLISKRREYLVFLQFEWSVPYLPIVLIWTLWLQETETIWNMNYWICCKNLRVSQLEAKEWSQAL